MKKICVFVLSVSMFLGVALSVEAGNNPPGFMFSGVLNGIKMDPRKGDFYLAQIQAVFLPTPSVKSKSIYPYNPDDGGKLWAILKKADGSEVARYDFFAELRKAPYWLLNSYKATETQTGNKPPSGRIHLDKGAYTLDFWVEGAHFYHFPFKVDVLSSTSDFNPEEFYYLDGAWNDWGYFYYRNAKPDQNIQWKVWLRNKGTESNTDAKVKLEVKRGGKLVSTNRANMTFSLRPEWIRYEFDLIFPPKGTSGGGYFKAKDLVSTDGAYTLSISVNGASYGTWKFKVAGGKFQPVGKTVRGTADPLTFVEGGVDAFWYKK